MAQVPGSGTAAGTTRLALMPTPGLVSKPKEFSTRSVVKAKP